MNDTLPSAALREFFWSRSWGGRPYLISPFFDFLMVGGLALLAFVALAIFFPYGGAHFTSQQFYVGAVMAWLAFMVNDPHFMVSYQLFYHRFFEKLKRFRDHRELHARYIVAGIVAPACMAVYFLYALATQNMLLFGYAVNAMLIVVGWHYVKQAFGVFMMLSALKKVYYSRWQRRFFLLNSYAAWVWYCMAAVSENGAGRLIARAVWGVDYHLPHLFNLSPQVTDIAGGMALSCGLLAAIVAMWGRTDPQFSRTGLLGYMSMYYLLFLAAFHPLWIVLYPFFHSLQYMLFVYAYKRGEAGTHLAQADAAQAKVIRRGIQRFALIAFLAGILLFAAIPSSLESFINPHKSFLFPLTAMFVLFINIHHYFLDNVIWRKEHAEISKYLFWK